jgi:hypothetical protein
VMKRFGFEWDAAQCRSAIAPHDPRHGEDAASR